MDQISFKNKIALLDKMNEEEDLETAINEITNLLEKKDLTDDQQLYLYHGRGQIFFGEYSYDSSKQTSGRNALMDYFHALQLSIKLGRDKVVDDIMIGKITQILGPIVVIEIMNEIHFKDSIEEKNSLIKQGYVFPNFGNNNTLDVKLFTDAIRTDEELNSIYKKIYSRMLHRVQTGIITSQNVPALLQDTYTIIGDEIRLKNYGGNMLIWIIVIVVIIGFIFLIF